MPDILNTRQDAIDKAKLWGSKLSHLNEMLEVEASPDQRPQTLAAVAQADAAEVVRLCALAQVLPNEERNKGNNDLNYCSNCGHEFDTIVGCKRCPTGDKPFQSWTLYKQTGKRDDVIEGPDIDGIKVIPIIYMESALDRISDHLVRSDTTDDTKIILREIGDILSFFID